MLSKILNYFEDFQPKYKIGVNYIGLVSIFLVFWLIHHIKLKTDFRLPELINLPNFIGNVDSVLLALASCFLVGFVLTRTTRFDKSFICRLSIGCGLLVGLAQNILIETRLGMDLLNQPNVSDPLDVVWGTIFCVLACLVSFRVREAK